MGRRKTPRGEGLSGHGHSDWETSGGGLRFRLEGGLDLEKGLDGVALHGLGKLRGPQPSVQVMVSKIYRLLCINLFDVLLYGGQVLDKSFDGSEVGIVVDQGAIQEHRRVLVYHLELDQPVTR